MSFGYHKTPKCYVIDLNKPNKIRIGVNQFVVDVIYSHIQIVNRGVPLDTSKYEIVINYKTVVGKVLSHKVININSNKGIIGLQAAYDLTKNFGEVQAELHIKKADRILSSYQFFVDVKKSVIQEGQEPTIDLLKVQQQVDEVERTIGDITNIQVKNVTNLVDAINKIDKTASNSLDSKKQMKKSEIDTILSIFDI